MTNTAMIPPSTGIDISVYESNYFPQALGNLFLEAGYTTGSYHEGNPTFYNHINTHPNWGLTAYHGSKEMEIDKPSFDSEMLKAFDMMTGNEPFYSFVLTVSAHGPYTDDSYEDVALAHIEEARTAIDEDSLPASCTDIEEYTHAVAQAMETDKFIGGLFEALKESGKLKDTALVLYSDHYAKYMRSTEMLLDLKQAENTDMLCNTPFIIYAEGIEHEDIEKVCSAMDVAPTIANLFNLDVNYAWYAGDDVFSDDGGYVIFRGNNWFDGEAYHAAGETTDDEYITA